MIRRAISTAQPHAHRLRVGIIGMGTAGLASALFLKGQGHDVSIYETTTTSDLDKIAGAGIGMQPIGLTVLKHLGVLDEALDRGARIDRLHAITRDDRDVLDLKYSDFRPGLHGLGLHRDVLFSILYRKVMQSDSISVVTGFRASTVAPNKQRTASDILEDDGKSREGPFDLVVVCDGRESIRRNMLGVRSMESKYPFGCLWTILPDKKEIFTSRHELYQRLDSCSTMLGFLPTGRTPAMSTKSATKDTSDDHGLVSIFWSLEMSSLKQVQARGLDAWKEQVIELEPRAESLLSNLTSFEQQLIPASYSDTFMPQLYDSETRTVFLGDAAHATSPQLGQGANLALVDAWVLSEVLEAADAGAKSGRAEYSSTAARDFLVQRTLHEFDRARKWRIRFYQLNSKILTPVFQSNSKLIGTLRDTFMGPLCKFPLTRLQMLTVLCGAQNNGIPWTTIPEEEYMGFVRDDER